MSNTWRKVASRHSAFHSPWWKLWTYFVIEVKWFRLPYFHNGLINFLVVRLVLHCIYLSLSHFQPFYWFFLANLRFQNVMQCLCNQLWKLEVHFRYKIVPINRFFNFGNKSKFTLVADLSAGLQHCVFL